MTFEEFEKEWQSIKTTPSSHDELKKMMHPPRFWFFEGLTKKDFISFFWKMAVFVTFAYFARFAEGWYWVIVWVSAFLNLVDEHFGFRYLQSFGLEETYLEIFENGIRRVKRIMIVTRTLYVVLWIALAYFAGVAWIEGNERALPMATIMLVGVGYFNWQSSLMWTDKMKELKALRDFWKKGGAKKEER